MPRYHVIAAESTERRKRKSIVGGVEQYKEQMSRVLLVRRTPRALQPREREELLRHFGAERAEARGHDEVLAVFPSHDVARAALRRLHQLELGGRRLVVEYAQDNEHEIINKPTDEGSPRGCRNVKEFINRLNAWNSALDFNQPPPPNLRYKYPNANPTILMNILFSIAKNKVFYTQVLHLMNKMSLDPPFAQNEEALNYFKDIFKFNFVQEIIEHEAAASETESEMSSDDVLKTEKHAAAKIVKRKHTLPITRKRPAAVLSAVANPKTKKAKVIKQSEVFEEVNLHEPKKISLLVSQDSLNRQQIPDTQVIGVIKRLQKEPSNQEEKADITDSAMKHENVTVSKQELSRNRISVSDMKILPVFKNYHPGEPSMRLYLKNLAKNVKEEDIKRIYGRYIESLDSLEQQGFDVRVMQEGRMKGQGFVTFPSVSIAEVALNETNGYILNDKPMVVQFARVSNKKPID